MKLSERIESVPASETIAITARAKKMSAEGIDVVSFAAGEPDFDTPQFIKDAAAAAMQAGDTKYTPRCGRQLIEAIVSKLACENDVHVKPSQVVVTFGAKHAVYAACQVLLDPGDKVLIPSPYWVSYPQMVKLAGAQPVVIPARPEDGFKIKPHQIIESADGAKLIILGSPCNPTGATYTPQELLELARAIMQTDMMVISDEIYEKLIYFGAPFVSLASLESQVPGIAARTITVNGVSKTFAMTGWRIGWAAGPEQVISAIGRLKSHETTNPVSFAQAAALAAYTDPQSPEVVEQMRLQFEKRARHMTERLNAIKGVRCVEPTGAFYCFPDVSEHFGRTFGARKITDSVQLAQVALEQAKVAVVPGAPFGEDRCIRLSFAASLEQIDKGLDRLEALLA